MRKLCLTIVLLTLTAICYCQSLSNKSKIDSLLNIAYDFYLEDKDSIRYYLDKVKVLALKSNDVDNIFEACIVDSWDSSYYGDLKRIKNNIEFLDSITVIYKHEFNSLANKTDRVIQLNYTKGQYYDEIKDSKTSNHYFNEIISIYEKLPDSAVSEAMLDLIKESNIYLAASYLKQNKLNEAEAYYKMNLRLIKAKTSDKTATFSTLMHLGNLCRRKKEYAKSNEYIFKCLPFYKKLIATGNNRVIVGYEIIIENFLDLKKLDSAKFYLKCLKDEFTENHSMYDRFLKVNSKVYEKEYDYKNALVALNQNLKFVNNKWEGIKNSEIAEAYHLIGKLNERFSNFKKALKNYNLALNQFSNDSINSTINQTIKFKILKNKANTIKNLKNYITSLKTADIAISILDSLKPSFKTNSDKLFLIENAFPLFENGINSAYQLYKQTNDSKYIDRAFFYSEKSKSTLLLESLLSTQATEFANIPEDLIEKEKQLKAKIAFLEKRINKKSTPDLQDELFDVKQDHRNLIQNIELNYKRYYDLKYNTQVLSLQDLQKWLDNDTVLLSYFYGTHSIYIISVTKNSTDIEQLKIDKAFETLLKDSYTLLSNPKSNLGLLKMKTHQLYQKIIQQSLVKSPQEKLIIIPDGLLNYLPFGSLSVNDTDYLIENHAVTYANSATLLMQLQSKSQHNNQVLAFAPSFENSSTSALLSLPNNTKEIKQVLAYFKGEAFLKEKASLKNFNSKNKDFGIIHLATHAILDDENPEYSYLAFSPNPESENSLFTNDLYNLELNANMVTLSACESGIGDLKRGEGMLSLARGFYFSGTSSIASTLWKVNDASSSQLMDGFYKNLSKGNTKDIALQRAKTNFISTNKDNALSHPYYWSGFIVSGNTSALTFSFKWQYIALALFVLIAFGLLFYKKKRSN